MSAITIENDLVHYEVLGRGRPVIFVHGWLGSWRYWVPTMQQLSVKYRTYALDLWGFGDSGKEANRYTFKDQVQLLYEFMDKLGITKAALVGHSLGAAVCLRFASMYPDRAPRVALISAPLFDLGGLDDNPAPVRAAVPAAAQVATSPAPAPVPAATGTIPIPAAPAAPATTPAPAPVAPSVPANAETIARNPFKAMGESPEEILARLQAKNKINSANVTAAPAQQPKPPSAPALPTGIGTPILPKTSSLTPPPDSASGAAPAAAPATTQTAPQQASPASTPAPTSAASATPAPATQTPTPAPTPAPAAPPAPAPTASISPIRTDAPNPLVRYLNGKPSELLSKYVAPDAPDLDKLMAEVKKTDEAAISKSTVSFNGVNLAVELQRLPSPTLVLHGKDDPVLPAPTAELLERINKGKPAGHLLAFVEPDVRHFPMLEITAKFNRLLMDFLEAADLSNVQFKDQWQRTLR